MAGERALKCEPRQFPCGCRVSMAVADSTWVWSWSVPAGFSLWRGSEARISPGAVFVEDHLVPGALSVPGKFGWRLFLFAG